MKYIWSFMALVLALSLVPAICWAQGLGPSSYSTDKPSGEIYGFAMTDMGYNAGRIDPQWFDVVRPTKLPGNDEEFGKDGSVYFSVRQTRFGTKFWMPANGRDVRGIFEWELFGTGADAGQTTIRLRHAYLQYAWFGAGQFWSTFMDIGIFPNTVEYWGPTGMVFFRNVQARFMPVMGDIHHFVISLEKPGASGDRGNYNSMIAERGLMPRFPVPDIAAHYKYNGGWGYLKLAGIVRRIQWDDPQAGTGTDPTDYSGNKTGWGLNLTTNVKAGPGTIKAGVIYGEGVENYMNDATVDGAPIPHPDDDPEDPTMPPTDVKLIPVLGTVLFYDWSWNEQWTSSLGCSTQDQDFAGTAVAADRFAKGRYGIFNVSWLPAPSLLTALELQYGRRENNGDGWTYDAFRIQFSAKYSFSFGLIG